MTELQNEQDKVKISDGCPEWADQLIRKIYLLEIDAGSIANPSKDQWNTKTQDELLKIARKLDGAVGTDVSEEADALFARVCKGLLSEHFSSEAIAQMINHRIPTGSRLNYCSPSEVLGSQEG